MLSPMFLLTIRQYNSDKSQATYRLHSIGKKEET
jgi:hypothetical protein